MNEILPLTADALRMEIAKTKWFHTIDFGNGISSPGFCPGHRLAEMADAFFRDELTGKTLADIGCWDGFFSIEAAKRGAIVTSVDYFAWHRGSGDRASFDLARRQLAPDIAVKEVDMLDLSPETVGAFDVVLYSGVLYHMRHPLLALERAASIADDLLIVETHMDASHVRRPAMVMYPTTEFNHDPTNWWGPNRACVEAMLRDVGFASITYQPHPSLPSRGIFHARRKV